MPVTQPLVSKTQDWKERNAASSVSAHSTHTANELYFDSSGFGGTPGGYDHTQTLPCFVLGNSTEHIDITHAVPSYWWNGQIKIKIIWVDIAGVASPNDLDIALYTWRIGQSTATTTVVDPAVEGADFLKSTTSSTADEVFEEEVWSSENMTEDDDVFHLTITSNTNGVNVGIASISVEYYPAFEQ